MGNDNEAEEIANKHSEEIGKIAAMREDNERKRAIEEMKAKYKFQCTMKELENYAQKFRDEHERKTKEINNAHTENMENINKHFNLENKKEDNRHNEELNRIDVEKKRSRKRNAIKSATS